MAIIKYFGIEGKNEEAEIRQFNEQFLKMGNEYTIINICGAQSFSRHSREIDLICIIHKKYKEGDNSKFSSSENYPNKKKLGNGDILDIKIGDKFQLRNTLFFMIEIKNHSKENITISGDDIYVKYGNKDSLVNGKFIEQGIVAKEKIQQISPTISSLPYGINVISLVYFPNAKKSDFELQNKEVRYGILFSDSNFQDLIKCALFHQGVYQKDLDYKNSFLGARIDNFESAIKDAEKYYQAMKPSRLEQQKLEQISAKIAEKNKDWVKDIGKNPIVFSGKAGTGKTLKLIRLANDLLEDISPTLFLTFNRALARDLHRLTELQRLSGKNSIKVWTIYKFLYNLAKTFKLYDKEQSDLINESDDFFATLRELILVGLEDESTLNKIRHSLFREFEYVAIDEAQDWLPEERDIIIKIFGSEKILLAVGYDQCMRSPSLAGWSLDFKRLGFKFQNVKSNTSLRLTSNLAKFNNNLADTLKLDWGVDINKEMLGGSIILFNNPTTEIYQNFLEELINQNQDYAPIDFLVIAKSKAYQQPKKIIENLNFNFWNGIDEIDRNEQIGINEVRGVSLESSRGLEGWSVLVLDTDYWWRWCIYHSRRLREQDDSQLQFGGENNFNHISDNDLLELPTWFLIPFTRAKNKLLIQLPQSGKLREIFLKLYNDNKDIITYINN